MTADLGWADRVDRDDLLRYEIGINALFPDGHALGVCLYDRGAARRDGWHRLVAAHPTAVATPGGRVVSRLRCVRTQAPPGLRLDGEVDATGLRFADVNALTCLMHVAVRRPGGRTRLVCRPHVAHLLRMIDADEVPGLTITETE